MILTEDNISTVTDLRRDTIAFLNEVKKKGMKYIFQRSKPQAVIMSIEEYQSWQEQLEEMNDILRVMELEKVDRKGWHSLEEVAKKHGVKL